MTGKIDYFTALSQDSDVLALQNALGADAKMHLVGGTVRDSLLGKSSKDLDFAVALLPSEVALRLQAKGIRIVPTGLKHQTVTAIVGEQQRNVEITTFRGPNMSPEGGVVPCSDIMEDLQYRDFTINAIAYDLKSRALIDPLDGVSDLKKGIISAVGEARERFLEDPLRTIRMVRMSVQTGFQIEEKTFKSAKGFAENIPSIAVERVRDEFTKILLSERPDEGLRLLLELGFLEHIMPEVAAFSAFEQNRFHKADLFDHTLEVISRAKADLVLRLACLLHDVGKPKTLSVDEAGDRHFFRHENVGADLTRDILRRLRYPKAVIHQVCCLVETHMRPLEAGPGGLRRLLRDTEEVFELWRELKEIDALSCKVEAETIKERLSQFDIAIEEAKKGPPVSPLKNLAINGKDLIRAGIEPGPKMGEILRALHERVLDDPSLNKADQLLSMLDEVAKSVE